MNRTDQLGRVRVEQQVRPPRVDRIEDGDTERLRTALQRHQEVAHLSRVAMLGGLSGAMAHEINQPLTAILGNAIAARRFIDHGTADARQLREILCDIAAEAERAAEIIRRLRSLMQPGQAVHQPVDLSAVVQETLQLLAGEIASRQVTLETGLSAALPAVEADRVQLQQVLINLVVNACDAMNETPVPARRLGIATAPAPGGRVLLSVADQGAGIAAELLPRLFDPFFTTKQRGLGLGLAVCQSIARAHDGQLWAENNSPGPGATFRLALPGLAGETP